MLVLVFISRPDGSLKWCCSNKFLHLQVRVFSLQTRAAVLSLLSRLVIRRGRKAVIIIVLKGTLWQEKNISVISMHLVQRWFSPVFGTKTGSGGSWELIGLLPVFVPTKVKSSLISTLLKIDIHLFWLLLHFDTYFYMKKKVLDMACLKFVWFHLLLNHFLSILSQLSCYCVHFFQGPTRL